jgi:hypothetical protein
VAVNEAEAWLEAPAEGEGLGWQRATSEIEPVSEAEVDARFARCDKAFFVWKALQALTARGEAVCHEKVQRWLDYNTLGGITVSARHYRRVKRQFLSFGTYWAPAVDPEEYGALMTARHKILHTARCQGDQQCQSFR